MTSTLVPVILSGGAGTRLWPLSRESAPKPFMPLPDGETLLGKTATRVLKLPGATGLLTVTNRDYYFHTKDVYGALGQTVDDARYLLEPFGRNTAPAVALAALLVEATHGGDACLLVLPADHLIRNQAAFEAAVQSAVHAADAKTLVTFGIAPTHPETGYGYIECDDAPMPASALGTDAPKSASAAGDDAPKAASAAGNAPPVVAARRFVEKPPLARAREYVASGHYVWNSGMFCFTARAIVAAFERYAPEVLAAVRPIWTALAAKGPGAMLEIDTALFAAVPDISIDYAVMEKAAADGAVAVVRGAFDWSDVGSWQAVSELSDPDADGNRGRGERVSIATSGTYVHAEDRVVATVGIENLVIVDTPDAVLVAHRDHLQRVKDVVGELKARGHEAYKLHKTVARPWGTYTVLQEGPGFKIKRIEVKPGASLSLQLHHRRSEHWVVVRGLAEVTRDDDVFRIGANESTYIPVETRHRLVNPDTGPLVMIEVQCGEYLGEDDIVRFDDKYGRVPA